VKLGAASALKSAIRHAHERFTAEWEAQAAPRLSSADRAAADRAFTIFCAEWFSAARDVAILLARAQSARAAWEDLCAIRPGLRNAPYIQEEHGEYGVVS
jgi:hypothetical protein